MRSQNHISRDAGFFIFRIWEISLLCKIMYLLRKYSIPEDVHLETIKSHLTNSGYLIITVSFLKLLRLKCGFYHDIDGLII